jgi:predicted hydrocarbon binding protein
MDNFDIFLSCAILMLKDNKKKYPDSRLMRIETFNLIQETLEKYTGKAALLLMTRLGELYGNSIMENKKFQQMNFNNLILASIKIGNNLNWFILSKKVFNNNEIILRFDSTFESVVHQKVDYSVCNFLTGYFKKISNSSKDNIICLCEETKCIAKGDEYCEFKIKKI